MSMDIAASRQAEPQRDSVPARFDALYWSHFLLGCGFLTPWSAFLGAIDYFKDIYPVESLPAMEEVDSVRA